MTVKLGKLVSSVRTELCYYVPYNRMLAIIVVILNGPFSFSFFFFFSVFSAGRSTAIAALTFCWNIVKAWRDTYCVGTREVFSRYPTPTHYCNYMHCVCAQYIPRTDSPPCFSEQLTRRKTRKHHVAHLRYYTYTYAWQVILALFYTD